MSGTQTHTSAGGEPSPTQRGERVFHDDQVIAERYRIVRFVAAGGMGQVYEAEDLQLGKRVAVKALPPSRASEQAIRRFRREISLAQGVTHPSVCRIHDLGFHGATAFLTMELLDGETLADRIARAGALSPAEALPLVEQMAMALDAAHEAGIIHRDFKSRNVMLTSSRAVVSDFGLAVQGGEEADGDDGPRAEGTGAAGTPGYMAPEQRTRARLTHAVDVYALGIVLQEMLLGRQGSAGEVDPGLDARIAPIVRRCLAEAPEDRYPTAGRVAAALRDAVGAGRARRAWLGIAAALAILAAVGGGFAFLRARDRAGTPARPRRVAVIGFRDLARQPETAWIGTALRELVSASLGSSKGITLVSGEAVLQASELLPLETDRFAAETLAKLRERLDADVIVSGSYLVQDGPAPLELIVLAQDARTGAQLESTKLLGAPDGLGHLASRAANRIVGSLGLRAEGHDQSPGLPMTQAPSDPEAARIYFEGIDRLRAGEALQARALLEQARALAPGDPHILLALGAALSDLGHKAEARSAFERARELADGLSEELRLYVDARLTVDQQAAARLFAELFAAHPDNPEYANRYWAALTRSGDRAAADRAMARMRESPALRESTQFLWMEALDAQALGDRARALELLDRLARRAERNGARGRYAEVLSRAAMIRFESGDLDGAAVDLREARRANLAASGHDFERNTLAQVAFEIALEQGNPEEAEHIAEIHRVYGERTDAPQAQATALALLAQLHRLRGDYAAAIRALDLSAELTRRVCVGCEDGAAADRALIAAEQHRWEEAAAAAEGLLASRERILPEDLAAAHVVLARARLARGKREEALEQAALAIKQAAGHDIRSRWSAAAVEAEIRAATGDAAGAVATLEGLVTEAVEKRYSLQSLLLRLALADALTASGARAHAEELRRAVAAEAKGMGFDGLVRRAGGRHP